jgi:hypothetical protein
MRSIVTAALVLCPLVVRADAGIDCTKLCVDDPVVVPWPGATDVPTNVQLMFQGTTPTLRDELAAEVPVDTTVVDGWSILTPKTPLKPQTTYVVDLSPSPMYEFTTGDGQDTTPPGTPTVKVTDGYSSCGLWVRLDVGAPKPPGNVDSLVAKVQVTDTSGARTTFFAPLDSSTGTIFGRSSAAGHCVVDYPAARAGVDFTITASLVDWAGNASKPSAAITFRFPSPIDEQTDGCRYGGQGSPLEFLPLLPLLGLFARRRRPRGR